LGVLRITIKAEKINEIDEYKRRIYSLRYENDQLHNELLRKQLNDQKQLESRDKVITDICKKINKLSRMEIDGDTEMDGDVEIDGTYTDDYSPKYNPLYNEKSESFTPTGGTVLGNHSNQNFITVDKIKTDKKTKKTIIAKMMLIECDQLKIMPL